MKFFLYLLLEGASLEEVQQELERKGLQAPFVIEDDATGEIWIGGHGKKAISIPQALLVEEKEASIDWNEQWTLFAENFTEGKAHIRLGNQTLLLTPGPGFGDLSHPTTHLMIEMMKPLVAGESVIDIGTGSGILALSALLLGAHSALGIDIDPAALRHAKENATINSLKARFSKTLPQKLSEGNLFLMNMILPEQREFKPDRLNRFAKLWIVSGILKSQREVYLAQAKQWGWEEVSEHQRSEWIGWVFKPKPISSNNT